MPDWGRKLYTPVLVALIFAGAAASGAALNEAEKIKEVVQASDILAPDYRKQVNVTVLPGAAAISVFRNPDATDRDCQIDAVLIAKKVMDTGSGAIKKVRVVFFEFAREDRYLEAVVQTADVSAFAVGKLKVDGLLTNVTLVRSRGNPLSAVYGGLSYRSIIDNLCVVEGPLRDERAAFLVRLRNLKSHGVDVLALNDGYLHAEDLARRGQETQLKAQMLALEKMADASLRNQDTTGSDERMARLCASKEQSEGLAGGLKAGPVAPYEAGAATRE